RASRAGARLRQSGMEHYKGFLIAGSAVPRFATGFDWDSQGIIFRSGRLGVEIKRIEAPIVNSKDAAEEHGLKLCKDWIDNRLDRPPSRRYRSLGGKLYATVR